MSRKSVAILITTLKLAEPITAIVPATLQRDLEQLRLLISTNLRLK